MRSSPRSMIVCARSVVAWRRGFSSDVSHSPSRLHVSVSQVVARVFASSMPGVTMQNRFREAFTAPSQTATLRAAEQTATVLNSVPSSTRGFEPTQTAQRVLVALGSVCARRRRRARPCPKHPTQPPVLRGNKVADRTNPVSDLRKSKVTRPQNQALQTTSVTLSGFGKVPDSDRHRRGV
jgi:hypothetical protein